MPDAPIPNATFRIALTPGIARPYGIERRLDVPGSADHGGWLACGHYPTRPAAEEARRAFAQAFLKRHPTWTVRLDDGADAPATPPHPEAA